MKRLVLTLILLACSMAVAGVDVSPAFLSAALQHQETLCPYLDVQNTWGKQTMRYARTPEMLYVSSTGTREVVSSFDRSLNEFRSMVTSSDGTKSGEISEEIDDLLGTQAIAETTRYNLYDGPLFEVVAKGTLDGTEGTVTKVKTVTEEAEYAFWLDSTIGYCPRKLEITRNLGKMVKLVTFDGYKEVSKGFWFPSTIHHVLTIDGAVKVDIVSKITSVSVTNRPTKSELTVAFPPGTLVTCGTVSYQVP